ncbi:MAG: glutamate--tRNA ligase [Gemmataceae bacterium]|nr:glutamate--tRNA ligase [Gemmataceae bacterium]
MSIRTRFAPSPTGYLHIGGVRTALFNWLLTRRLGGQFVLRIDDTDTERNRPEALQPILDGFRWLGMTWDEGPEVGGPHGPYFQSQRGDLYRDAALRLLAGGHAYPDYTPAEEKAARRKDAEAAKQSYVHRGTHRDAAPAACQQLYAERPTVLLLKVPAGRTVAIDDAIRGHVEWQTNTIADPAILRPDGTPLYNFATAIDDTAMRMTHVIRAAEHLSNTPVQVLIYEALGHTPPKFAHVPLVYLGGKKMSKRDAEKLRTPEALAGLRAIGFSDEEIRTRVDLNPISVAYYRELGYLPAALVNYLGRLGWSLGDEEVIPLDRMIAHFGLEQVNDAPGNFDPAKLYWLAGEYLRKLPLAERVAGVIPFLRRAGLLPDRPLDEATDAKVQRVVAACGDRLKLFSEILVYGAFFFKDPAYDPKSVKARLHKAGVPDGVRAFKAVLADVPSFEPAPLEEALRTFCTQRGLKFGDIVHGLRVGTTGVMIGPGVFDCLAILGREESLRRIDMALTLKV